MTGELKEQQQRILDFLKKWILEKGYPPSVREIGAAVGLSSTSTVHSHLRALEAKGYIRRDPTKTRAIEILDNDPELMRKRSIKIPVVGRVAAGQPLLASQNIEDAFPLPEEMVGPGTYFLLRVKGDSMVGAGILDGDYVLVRQQPTAADGDIVVALIENEATVKRFFRGKAGVRLEPENPAFEPILAPDVEIVGKVTGLLRLMV